MNGKRALLAATATSLGLTERTAAAFLLSFPKHTSHFFHASATAAASARAAATSLRAVPLSALAVGALSLSSLSRAVSAVAASVRACGLVRVVYLPQCAARRQIASRLRTTKKGPRGSIE